MGEICRKLKDAVSKYEAYAFRFGDLIGGVFAAQPTTALEALCGGDPQELASGLGIIRDLRHNTLDSMPEGELFKWCDCEPTTRYPAIAATITIWSGTKESEPPEWTNLSVSLLDKATDRIGILKQYVTELELMRWRGSRGAALASNVKLLDRLQAHPDPLVAQFVAQESARLGQLADNLRRSEREAEREKDERFE